MEQALCVRIDFLQFCGLSLSDAIPDKTTLCRFRNRLVTSDRLDDLLIAINKQFQSHNVRGIHTAPANQSEMMHF
ncbi:MAG: transposase [Pseudomonadota bacterium]